MQTHISHQMQAHVSYQMQTHVSHQMQTHQPSDAGTRQPSGGVKQSLRNFWGFCYTIASNLVRSVQVYPRMHGL